jgi:hypothetical protein
MLSKKRRFNNIKLDKPIILNMNFKRNKFFPTLNFLMDKLSNKQNTLMTLSLGLLNKNMGFKRSVKSSKQSYLRTSDFLKRTLIFMSPFTVTLRIKGIPKYLKDVLGKIFGRSDKAVVDPRTKNVISDSLVNSGSFNIDNVVFSKNYGYSDLKKKKKGKVKRKIAKRLMKLNNILD